jgi:hypothetical protein
MFGADIMAAPGDGLRALAHPDGSVPLKVFDYLGRLRGRIGRRRKRFRRLLEATADEIWFTDSAGEARRIPWANVRKIAAFKRDLFATDLICWAIELAEPFRRGEQEIRIVEIDEEIDGFKAVADEAARRNMVDRSGSPW